VGRALASALPVPHHDTDDHCWRPGDPPYRNPRPLVERLQLARELFLPLPGWVLGGSPESGVRTLRRCSITSFSCSFRQKCGSRACASGKPVFSAMTSSERAAGGTKRQRNFSSGRLNTMMERAKGAAWGVARHSELSRSADRWGPFRRSDRGGHRTIPRGFGAIVICGTIRAAAHRAAKPARRRLSHAPTRCRCGEGTIAA